MKSGVYVRDAMTKMPVVVAPNKPVEECARIMLQNKVGSLIVQEKGKLLGIITEKDFIDRIIAIGLDPKKLEAKDIMKKDIITISPDIDINDAMLKMSKEGVKRFPVIENNKMVGYLTYSDVLRIQPTLFELFLERMTIKEEGSKPLYKSNNGIEGECEKCHAFTLLNNANGRFLCNECK